jgi:hypothetical protein
VISSEAVARAVARGRDKARVTQAVVSVGTDVANVMTAPTARLREPEAPPSAAAAETAAEDLAEEGAGSDSRRRGSTPEDSTLVCSRVSCSWCRYKSTHAQHSRIGSDRECSVDLQGTRSTRSTARCKSLQFRRSSSRARGTPCAGYLWDFRLARGQSTVPTQGEALNEPNDQGGALW